ncbi:hypothetical protein PF004_g30521 [Phytophthora fragariae]|uniref:Uncharacterized protein n=1 Tax=Phytophthora fragariae TaxID=53985 RepID=A0A6G0MBN6_9STRA|nr:hypothetical protein PF004_g30521 [Phytophthora fragariae]
MTDVSPAGMTDATRAEMTDVVAETIVVIAESQWLKHRTMTCTMGLTLANRAAESTRLDLQAVPAVAASTANPSLIRIRTTLMPEQEVSERVVRATRRNVAEMTVRPAVMIPPSVNTVVAEMIHVREGHLTDVVAEVTPVSDRAMVHDVGRCEMFQRFEKLTKFVRTSVDKSTVPADLQDIYEPKNLN